MGRKYLFVGIAGAALVLAGPLLPYPGRSPLGATFLSVFPGAAAGIAGLAVVAAAAVWRRALRISLAALAPILVTGYAFFSRYYYPNHEYSLLGEPGRRATAIPGWVCLETGTLLVLAACLGLYFTRERK